MIVPLVMRREFPVSGVGQDVWFVALQADLTRRPPEVEAIRVVRGQTYKASCSSLSFVWSSLSDECGCTSGLAVMWPGDKIWQRCLVILISHSCFGKRSRRSILSSHPCHHERVFRKSVAMLSDSLQRFLVVGEC